MMKTMIRALALVFLLLAPGAAAAQTYGAGYNTATNRAEIDCRHYQAGGTGILLIAGQSNAASYTATAGIGSTTPVGDVGNLNPQSGKCYRAAVPLLGPDTDATAGESGTYWIKVANLLIQRGVFQRVLIVNVALGGTEIARWVPSANDLFPRITSARNALARAGLKPTVFLWHQGERDSGLGTTQSAYATAFSAIRTALTGDGLKIIPAVASYNNGTLSSAVRAAQQGLASLGSDVVVGPDTDIISAYGRRDNTHWNSAGASVVADMWADAIQTALAQ